MQEWGVEDEEENSKEEAQNESGQGKAPGLSEEEVVSIHMMPSIVQTPKVVNFGFKESLSNI